MALNDAVHDALHGLLDDALQALDGVSSCEPMSAWGAVGALQILLGHAHSLVCNCGSPTHDTDRELAELAWRQHRELELPFED